MDTKSIKLVPFETFMESVETARAENPFYQEGRLTRFWDNVKNDLGFSKSDDDSDDGWDDEDGETPQKKESIIKRVLAILKKIVTAIFKFIPTIVKNLKYIEPRHFKGKGANAKVYVVNDALVLYNTINHSLNAWVEPLTPDEIVKQLTTGIKSILLDTDQNVYGVPHDDIKNRVTGVFFPYMLEENTIISSLLKEIDNRETVEILNGQMLSISNSGFTYGVKVSDLCKSINRGINIENDIRNNFKNFKPPVVELVGNKYVTINGERVDIRDSLTDEDVQKLIEINNVIPKIVTEYTAKIKRLLEFHNMYITNMSAAIDKIDPDIIKSYKEYVI